MYFCEKLLKMLFKRIENWLVHFQKYFFTYSNGFFNLSYLMNSPQVMINCMEKMPFVKYNKVLQKINTNNPFCEGTIYHQDIEDGLTLLLTDVKFKANLKIKLIYDKYLPVEHYNLVMHIDKVSFPTIHENIANIKYEKNFWIFIKPGSIDSDYHLKGTHGYYVSLHFTEKWIEKNIQTNEKIQALQSFIQSENKFNIWHDDSKDLEAIYNTFYEIIGERKEVKNIDTLRLKLKTYEFIDIFFTRVFIRKESKITSGKEIQKMLIAEKILLEDMSYFIGVEALAKKTGISSSKLKNDFKKAFGKSVYKYYNEKQLTIASAYLKNPDYKIKDVALLFGYENPSKFTKAYKELFGILPSEVK